VRRLGIVLATAAAVVLGLAGTAAAGQHHDSGKHRGKHHGDRHHGGRHHGGGHGSEYHYKAPRAVKINVMGEWAHPDDDTSIIGPCGVWHARYGTRCGVIMVTRGEGGGNAVGTEIGPALGLRRENEDRIAHYRSGTVDIFNLDRVDFFYNTSAPLTQYFWDHDETLRRITRVIRMTQPDVYIGFTPTLNAGHGNHQQAGRFIWEGVLAAADPSMFPEQLRGPHALDTWQVKKVFSGGSTSGSGGTTDAADCTTGFTPAATNLDTVVGSWLGYDSPYLWPEGNIQGKDAGSPKIWGQIASEGRSAYPTQSRTMFQGVANPSCSRFGMTESFVPFQPNVWPDGSLNDTAGRDDAVLFGASQADPGGLPKGTLEYITFSSFYNAPATPFEATVHLQSGGRALRRGRVELGVPAGWTVDRTSRRVRRVRSSRERTVTFTVTPAADAAVNQNYKLSAIYRTGSATGYTDNVMRVVSPVEGRFERWGKWEEYDSWLEDVAPQARRLGRSAAQQSIGVGETLTVPVDVHNWSDQEQTGDVSIDLPANFSADATTKTYGTLAPGADTTVEFEVTNNDTALPASPADTTVNIPIATTYSAPAGTGSETLQMSIVPTTSIPEAGAAPSVDAQEGAGEYSGPRLDVGRRWEGRVCDPLEVDCGTPGTPGDPSPSTYAKATWNGDDLYFFVHVQDEFQSYAVTPAECVAHWLADSVEFLIDPRGNASQVNRDTANTFKLGVFPFTNDPTGSNGNGANGPCWERDADNHQGYATGPLADTVSDAPNAPGVEVASSATWVGSNETTVDHSYAGGGYNLEVKIPMADLPAAVNPDKIGLNITPYDEDDTSAAGTTTLRHIDQSSRLAWSPFGSVQSDPWRWGHASVDGYAPPADRPTEPEPPNVSNPNLNGVESPETIAQSARDGVPIAGRDPAPANDRIQVVRARLRGNRAELDLTATGAGTAHVYLWAGNKGYIPVWLTSCTPQADPPPDYGFTPCAETDGGIPQWSPDMSGRVKGSATVTLSRGAQRVSIPLDAAARDALAADGSALISFETAAGEVQALDIRLAGM
jgi:GlcNAc-PI de-N-acetylase/NPCBM-associated, NEW3 domain of alpha-galactosidase